MMTEREKYFSILFQKLKKFDLLPNPKNIAQWRWDFQKYYRNSKIESHIFADIRAEFGVGFENVALVNCKKYTLLSKFFCNKTNILFLQTAVYFTLLGCIMDYLLDNGSIHQKKTAQEKLSWEYAKDYFEDFKEAKSNSIIDQLYAFVAKGFSDIYGYDLDKYYNLIGMVKNVIQAELYVVDTKTITFEYPMVMDKSILFILIASEIALIESQKIGGNSKIFYLIGEVFAWIDDACDIFEDMKNGQKNMVWYELNKNNNMEIILEKVVQTIYHHLELIKKYTNIEIYQFFLAETQEWVFSCKELREKIWNCERK